MIDTKKAERCRILLSRSPANRVPADGDLPSPKIVTLTINDFETKEVSALPDLTIMFCQRLRAGNGASKMPICGHAVVKRAKWSAPAVQQILLFVEKTEADELPGITIVFFQKSRAGRG